MAMVWQIFEGELDHDDVGKLLAQHFAEMRSGSPPEACHVLPIDGLKEPEICFFTLRENGVLLGCGALKRLDSGHGEIKSMRTADAALGRGVGQAILDQLVSTARLVGITRLSLETGSTDQFAAANRLYEKNGFERTGPFGDYADTPWTHFYTREI
jgi:putative acetyltransferase